ncbi:MAG: hypothetical protein LUI06_08110 [Ruminococcus sp.]|nr:hypothetical protein [Ruminococcus sp.]
MWLVESLYLICEEIRSLRIARTLFGKVSPFRAMLFEMGTAVPVPLVGALGKCKRLISEFSMHIRIHHLNEEQMKSKIPLFADFPQKVQALKKFLYTLYGVYRTG